MRFGLRVLPFLVVALIYAVVAGHQIDLPGVYMDAVNPDYLAARLLNPGSDNVPIWVLPGNNVAGRYPVLVSLYHGTQQLWLGLPVFWLLGTTVTSLRIAHALFAVTVLAAFYVVLVRARLAPWVAAGVAVALAIDPSFVYSFRTQSYITMAPAAWLLLSVLALERRVSTPGGSTGWIFTSGVLAGLSIFGYFIYTFYLPALAVAVLGWRGAHEKTTTRTRSRVVVCWVAGLALGCIFYFVGYALIADALSGWRGLRDYIVHSQAELGAFAAQSTLWDRLVIEWSFIEAVFFNRWHDALMFADYAPVPAATWKIALLLGAPLLLWILAELRHRSSPMLRLLLGLEASFCTVALIFGSRLGGHHFVSLLPLSYAALAVAIRATPIVYTSARNPASPIAILLAVAGLVAINVRGVMHVSDLLQRTHGVGLYSDAINRFADDLRRDAGNAVLFTPDWGLFMPVAFLTGGQVKLATTQDFALARHALCVGRPVMVALIDGDRHARFAEWERELEALPPAIEQYRQFDGNTVFEVARYERDPARPCSENRASKP